MGSCQPLGQSGQRLLPIRHLRGDAGCRLSVETHPSCRALPQRVIDILHRQRRPIRARVRHTGRHSAAPRSAHQRSDRPAVRGDVMHDRHQHVLVLADGGKVLCPQWALGGQVETGDASPRRRPHSSRSVRPAGRHQLHPSRSRPAQQATTSCWGTPSGSGEHRAQALVAAHHIDQRLRRAPRHPNARCSRSATAKL